jgi:hypothetical protein
MPHSEANDNLQDMSDHRILSLVADEDCKIILSDRPVFGANLTFKEDIGDLIDTIVFPNQLIGWIDYSQLTKLACLNQQQYFDAQQFISVQENQLFFSQIVKVHSVNKNLKESKTILTFSLLPKAQKGVVVSIRP